MAIILQDPQQKFVTFKMVPLASDDASNLALFGTPWGQQGRRTRGLRQRRILTGVPWLSYLAGKHMPWFTAKDDEESNMENIPENIF